MRRMLNKIFDGNVIVSGGDSKKEVKDLLVGPDDTVVTDGIFQQVAVHEKDGSIRYHMYLVGETYVIIIVGLANKAVGPTLMLHIRQTPCDDVVYYRALDALKRIYDKGIIDSMVYYAKHWRNGCVIPDGIKGENLCEL